MSNLKFIKKLAYWDRNTNFSNLLKLSANETKPPWVAKFISDKKDFYQEGNLFVGIGFYKPFTPMAFGIANGKARYSIVKGYFELKKLNANDYSVTLSGSTPENFVDTSNGFCYSIIKIPETSIKIEKKSQPQAQQVEPQVQQTQSQQAQSQQAQPQVQQTQQSQAKPGSQSVRDRASSAFDELDGN